MGFYEFRETSLAAALPFNQEISPNYDIRDTYTLPRWFVCQCNRDAWTTGLPGRAH